MSTDQLHMPEVGEPDRPSRSAPAGLAAWRGDSLWGVDSRVLDLLPVAVYFCDAEGVVVRWNRGAAELWGREPVPGRRERYCGSHKLYGPDGAFMAHRDCPMADALRTGVPQRVPEVILERPDGSRRHIMVTIDPLRDESGKVIGAVNVFQDISARKKAQEQIRELLATEQEQSERLRDADRRKDEFLAMLAHELRNPLAPIRSGLELLAMGEDAGREVIDLMRSQVDHLVRLVDDLLDVARIVRGRVDLRTETLDLGALIRRSVDAVRPAIESCGHQMSVSSPRTPIWIHADAVRMVQVIENLLNNASKYTDRGGRIELIAEESGGEAVIAVQDNGVGIEPDLLPKVFEPFSQSTRSLDRSQGGLGIGLTLVKSLVELHGGSVMAESEGPGRGSRFEVRLPLAKSTPKTETPLPEPKPPERRRVLIVDDSVGAAKILARLVRHLGPHVIEIAHDGPSAIERAESFQPEIMLLDIGLPKMDGFTVARKLRENGGIDGALLVALTGYGQEEDRRRSKEAGFDEHVVKPVAVETLRQLLSHPKLSA